MWVACYILMTLYPSKFNEPSACWRTFGANMTVWQPGLGPVLVWLLQSKVFMSNFFSKLISFRGRRVFPSPSSFHFFQKYSNPVESSSHYILYCVRPIRRILHNDNIVCWKFAWLSHSKKLKRTYIRWLCYRRFRARVGKVECTQKYHSYFLYKKKITRAHNACIINLFFFFFVTFLECAVYFKM